MTLPLSGPLTVSQIQTELKEAGVFTIGASTSRGLAGVLSGPIPVSAFYGKSRVPVMGLDCTIQPGLAAAINGASVNAVNSICYGNGVWIAAGHNGKLAYSTDNCVTWTLSSSYTSQVGSVSSTRCVEFNGSMFLAIADNGKCCYSYDGINWTLSSSFYTAFGNVGAPNSIAWNGTLWAVVSRKGTAAACATSPDGITWTLSSSYSALYGATGSASKTVCWTGSYFIAPGYNKCVRSQDGITWEECGASTYPALVGLNVCSTSVHSNGRIFASVYDANITKRTAVYSLDNGTTWARDDAFMTATQTLTGVDSCVGSDGKIYVPVYSGANILMIFDGATWFSNPDFDAAIDDTVFISGIYATAGMLAVVGWTGDYQAFCATSP